MQSGRVAAHGAQSSPLRPPSCRPTARDGSRGCNGASLITPSDGNGAPPAPSASGGDH
ncbi:hypothetical protein C7S16_5524 [Burkholderia thailandensis]|uniref:Uncharacterized protein n=1 Tax=Burkholderia thailandensis TaxID=57975 RepID=A0AAW9CXN1_BURTH|nr:hypothetical protein [Burkholderia thailandensis]MDW9252476.1 hypothetical protein [Burkholderia thailandensis]